MTPPSYQHQDTEALLVPEHLSVVETTATSTATAENEEDDDTACRQGRMHVAMILTLMVGVFFAYVLLS